MPSLVGGYLAVVTLFMVFVLHISVSPERFLLLMLIGALVLGRARLFLAHWMDYPPAGLCGWFAGPLGVRR